MKFKTAAAKIIKLSSVRREHIITTHPIMEAYLGKLKMVLEKPDEIRYSNYADDVLLFYRYFDKIEGGKYIAVVVNLIGAIIITAYLTSRIKTGEKYEKK